MSALSAGATRPGSPSLVHPAWLRVTHWLNALPLLIW